MFERRGSALFSDHELNSVLSNQEQQARLEIESYDGNRLLNTPVEDLVKYFASKFDIEPLTLLEDNISTDQIDASIPTRHLPNGLFMYGDHQREVPGTIYSFFVPFSGERELFKVRPNSFNLNAPSAEVREHELVFSFPTPQTNAGAIKDDFLRQLNGVKQNIQNQRTQISGFRERLPNIVREKLNERRERLLNAQKTAAGLGYPVRRRQGEPTTYAAPEVRRRLPAVAPPVSSAPYVAEPALDMQEYEHILDILSNMAVVLERSPSAFVNMREEDLRQHFLVQLNGHYEGAATGETFNAEGKTDILIRSDGKNIFIGECKFWRGPSTVSDATDQLLSYLSWRDTKAAVIIFNRDTALSTVLAKVPDEVRKHQNYKRDATVTGESRFRAIFSHRNDPSRELIVTFLAFDVPGSATKP